MILYGAAFLFAHRIIDLLEQLVENRHYHSNNTEDNNEETGNYDTYVSQYHSDKAEDNTRWPSLCVQSWFLCYWPLLPKRLRALLLTDRNGKV